MKNHIKNCIKIMGLAAVPFGTAQIHGNPPECKLIVRWVEQGKMLSFTLSSKGEQKIKPRLTQEKRECIQIPVLKVGEVPVWEEACEIGAENGSPGSFNVIKFVPIY